MKKNLIVIFIALLIDIGFLLTYPRDYFELIHGIIISSVVITAFIFCFWQEYDEKQREKLKNESI